MYRTGFRLLLMLSVLIVEDGSRCEIGVCLGDGVVVILRFLRVVIVC